METRDERQCGSMNRTHQHHLIVVLNNKWSDQLVRNLSDFAPASRPANHEVRIQVARISMPCSSNWIVYSIQQQKQLTVSQSASN